MRQLVQDLFLHLLFDKLKQCVTAYLGIKKLNGNQQEPAIYSGSLYLQLYLVLSEKH